MKESFHPYMIYAWHYAKCTGQSDVTNHSHRIVSYDREWIERMSGRIKLALEFKPLTEEDSEQILLEEQACRLIQRRKSLEEDLRFKERGTQ